MQQGHALPGRQSTCSAQRASAEHAAWCNRRGAAGSWLTIISYLGASQACGATARHDGGRQRTRDSSGDEESSSPAVDNVPACNRW
jgi:hypothetical protein